MPPRPVRPSTRVGVEPGDDHRVGWRALARIDAGSGVQGQTIAALQLGDAQAVKLSGDAAAKVG